MADNLLTTRELERLLQLDRVTIYRMVREGELPALRIGGQWRFSQAAVEKWLSGQESDPAPSPQEQAGGADELRLPDLIPLETLHSIQDQFALLLGVASFTTDLSGKPFVPCSRCSQFCRLVHGTPQGMAACEASWRELASKPKEQAEIHRCHAGIYYAGASILVDGEPIGMVTAGQFLTAAPEPAAFREAALETGARVGVDGEALAAAAGSLEIVDEQRALQITGLLATIANTLSAIGYQGHQMRRKLAQIAELSAHVPDHRQ